MKKTFYSNGKLLLTGEYTVLDGATALALPTKFGQYLHVNSGSGKTVKWKSLDADGPVWYQEEIPFDAVTQNKQQGSSRETDALIKILHEAHKANPLILEQSGGFDIITELTFPRKWGLGTSSTLINNIAQWFSTDAFQLLEKSFGGSGYDIACAQNNTPLLYRLEDGSPIVQTIDFNPSFANNLYFIYLNKKQDSRQAIAAYREHTGDLKTVTRKITQLTQDALHAASADEFSDTLEKHEELMADVLSLPTVKNALFPDFNGTLKSLGAWGGDFILAVAKEDPSDYFLQRGYTTVIPYNEMILK